MDCFCRVVVRIRWAKSTCSFDYFFCTAVAGRFVLRDLLPTPGWLQRWGYLGMWNLPWQPGLKYTGPILFFFKGLLHSCQMSGTFASPVRILNSWLSGDSVTRGATTTPLQVSWESRAGCCSVCFSVSGAACGWDPAQTLPSPSHPWELWWELLFTDSTEMGSSHHFPGETLQC